MQVGCKDKTKLASVQRVSYRCGTYSMYNKELKDGTAWHLLDTTHIALTTLVTPQLKGELGGLSLAEHLATNLQPSGAC